ncbi:uncharacterized protein LOC135081814 [Ostrinia nubilalis]|uniref:uncharacterized protein LOC135081814 n=1 Tax=Ostrinia nubilalis TaxID=29057 RepID=UPI003082407E
MVMDDKCMGLSRNIDTSFLVFINRLLAFLVALGRLLCTQQPLVSAPLYKFSYCSVTNIISAWCQYEALKYVSFPTQVLSKSCKVIPVMMMGKLISRTKYELYEYVTAVMISVMVLLLSLIVMSANVRRRCYRSYVLSKSCKVIPVMRMGKLISCTKYVTAVISLLLSPIVLSKSCKVIPVMMMGKLISCTKYVTAVISLLLSPIVLSKSCKVIPVMMMGKLISRTKYELYEYVTAVMISVMVLSKSCKVIPVLRMGRLISCTKYVTAVLSKSCKVIPVMMMGKLISRTKYELYEYVTAVMISVLLKSCKVIPVMTIGKLILCTKYVTAVISVMVLLLSPIVLSMSCKVIPVMMMGKLISRTKYEMYDYVTAVMIRGHGVVIFPFSNVC